MTTLDLDMKTLISLKIISFFIQQNPLLGTKKKDYATKMLNMEIDEGFMAKRQVLKRIGTKFFYYKKKTQRVDVFSSDDLMERLAAADVIVSDGTFDSAPQGYYQMFIINGSSGPGNIYFPCAFCFLTSNS